MKSIYLEKIKELGITKIILILLAGILLVISSFDITKTQEISKDTGDAQGYNIPVNYGVNGDLAMSIEGILGSIYGISSIKVLVTYEDLGEKILISNETRDTEVTNETDSQGGTRHETRESNSNEYVISGNDEPYVVNQYNPQILGVLVVYQGSNELKTDITEAVSVLTGIGVNKIKVITMN